MTAGQGDYSPAVIYVPPPAAGADVTFTTPGSEYQDLVCVSFTLTTSATVGNRTPVLEIVDGAGRVIAGCAAGYATTASSTAQYSFVRGLSEWDSAGTSFASGPVPRVPLQLGDAVKVHIDGIDATDQLSAVTIVVTQLGVRPDDRPRG